MNKTDAPTPKEARAEGRGHSAVCKGGETPGQWSLNDLLIGVREHIREFPGVCKNIRDDVSDLLESIDNHIFFESLGKEPRPPVREDAPVDGENCGACSDRDPAPDNHVGCVFAKNRDREDAGEPDVYAFNRAMAATDGVNYPQGLYGWMGFAGAIYRAGWLDRRKK